MYSTIRWWRGGVVVVCVSTYIWSSLSYAVPDAFFILYAYILKTLNSTSSSLYTQLCTPNSPCSTANELKKPHAFGSSGQFYCHKDVLAVQHYEVFNDKPKLAKVLSWIVTANQKNSESCQARKKAVQLNNSEYTSCTKLSHPSSISDLCLPLRLLGSQMKAEMVKICISRNFNYW